jgi:hypothetical protein
MKLKQGDIITNTDGNKAKILAVCGEAVLRSDLNYFDEAHAWFTEKELIKDGWQFPKEEWVPKLREKYWGITHDGFVNSFMWDNDKTDNNIKNFLGIYPNEESAQQALQDIKRKLGK